jgi:hypothetical protein
LQLRALGIDLPDIDRHCTRAYEDEHHDSDCHTGCSAFTFVCTPCLFD